MRTVAGRAGLDALARIVRQVPRARLALLLGLTLLAVLAEGVGIVLLVPIIGLLGGAPMAGGVLPGSVLAAATANPLLLFAGFAAMLIIRALLMQWQQSEAAALQRRLIDNLRRSAMRAIVGAEWRWLSQQRVSENASLLLGDLTRLGWGIGHLFGLLSTAMAMLIYLTACLALSWPATLLALAFGTGLYAAAHRSRQRTVQLGEAIGDSMAALHRDVEETLTGLKLIKSLSREPLRIVSLDEALTRLDAQHGEVIANAGRARLLMDSASAVFLAVLAYAALGWLNIPGERLLPLVIIFARFVPLLTGAQHGVLHWLNAVPALRRVTALIDDAAAHAEPGNAGGAIGEVRDIRIEIDRFAYPGAARPLLAGVSLALAVPGTTAITGASGAGKSTLADILGGLIEPDAGRLLINGAIISGADRVRWRRSVAYVQQDAFFFDSSIADNLRMAKPGAPDDELWAALDDAAARFVRDLPEGLDTRMGNGGKRFSGGERQRLALARALLASPALLILDEATSALDRDSERAVVETLERRRSTMAMMVISHRLIEGLTIDCHLAVAS